LRTAISDVDAPDELKGLQPEPEFRVYASNDFLDVNSPQKITSGASVFLYRVLPNLTHRTPAGRVSMNGLQHIPRLPLDLHIIVTIWSKNPGVQHHLLGWVMRTLEDYPVIPASLLNINSPYPNRLSFEEDESIELILGEMGGEELLHLWDLLGVQSSTEFCYQISIPYLVRNVCIDSQRTRVSGEPVQSRTLDMQQVEASRT
jgi:hypothetical protein